MLSLSIVIPAYNEHDRLAAGFARLEPVLQAIGLDNVEVIVIDDGSTDNTALGVQTIYGHLPHTVFVRQEKNQGKGAALRLGLSLARGEVVICADADMAIDPACFPSMIEMLGHADLAPGTRAANGRIRYRRMSRTLAGAAFNRVVRHYAATTLRDTQCGCKAYSLTTGRVLGLFSQVNGFAFDAEVLYLASQLGLTVTPVPVAWQDVSGSSVRVGRDSLGMLKDMRALRKTKYENPAIEFEQPIEPTAVKALAQQAGITGLVLCQTSTATLLLLPRENPVAGLHVTQSVKGRLRTVSLGELRGATLTAL